MPDAVHCKAQHEATSISRLNASLRKLDFVIHTVNAAELNLKRKSAVQSKVTY